MKSSVCRKPSERAPALSKDDRKDFRKPFSRGRGQRVYIQTEGSFLEQGPALRLKKETVVPHYDRIPRSSSRMKLEMENKINAGQINFLLEEYDEKDAYLDYENDMQPVRFPYIKKKTKPKIKDVILGNEDVKPKIKEEILDDEDAKPKIKEEILDNEDVKPKIQAEILDNEDVKPKIKKEPEDNTDETKKSVISKPRNGPPSKLTNREKRYVFKSLRLNPRITASQIANDIRPKEHHPALPRHPGKQLKDRPPQQIVGHCGSCIIAPHYERSKEPHRHYCAIGLTRACLLIRQPLLRELTVSPRWEQMTLERDLKKKKKIREDTMRKILKKL
ncbi:hypothetical protein AVEN_272483-1 [Araneus ventricosus]|uniref:Uncharacterized protein n=1 Tax=Araneus ventricosus TaxID=182803 RepID=A0A4Y2K8T7_ARAVE|nr:hypothetical protein AVEN_272483-1 [Araneus ventricosus]